MSLMGIDKDLEAAIRFVRADFFDESTKDKKHITKADFEQIFYRLLMVMPVDKASNLTNQLNKLLIMEGMIFRDENPGVSITKIKRPKARINVDVIGSINKLLDLEKIFISDLDNVFHKDIELNVGRILFSAIRYGALMRPELIASFLYSLGKVPNLYENKIWFELEVKGHPDAQIWSPDPLTLLLLQEWYAKEKDKQWQLKLENSKPKFFDFVKKYFLKQGVVWTRGGMGQKALLEAISARLSLDIPPSLVDCASSVHDARSLNPKTYIRLLTGKSPSLEIESIQTSQKYSKKTALQSKFQEKGDQLGIGDNALIKDVGRILRRGGAQKQSATELNELISKSRINCTPVVVYLSEWIAYRLTHANRWGNRFRTKSAYTRLCSVAKRLRGWCGASDLTQIGRDKFIEIYEEILDEDLSEGLRLSIAKNLRDFHEFLEDEHGVEGLKGDAPWGMVSGKTVGVDAKIVFYNEYEAAWDYLYNQITQSTASLEDSLCIVRAIILSIGFKCGLRRKEVALLRLKDITVVGSPEILVRAHAERSLKSSSGNRRIPLSVLLSNKEWELLKQWLNKRIKEAANPEDYLFSIPELGTPFIDETLIFDQIQWVLQIITGDKNTRFHHLRHSYATWAFWRWMSPRYGYNKNLYLGLPALEKKNIKRERRYLLDLKRGDEPSQKTLYALSMSIGHSGPSMTLNHYIHSAQWMLELELKRITPALSCNVIAKLTGISERQVQKLSKNKTVNASVVQNRVLSKLKVKSNVTNIQGWRNAKDIKIGRYKLGLIKPPTLALELLEILQKYSYHDIPIDELVERYNISRNTIETAIIKAKQISNLKYINAAHKTFRHRWHEWQEMELPPLVFPFPRQKRHLLLAEHIVSEYNSLAESRKKLVKWGVQYFLENGTANKSTIKFTKKEELRRYVRMLNVLNLYARKEGCPNLKHPRFRFTLVTTHEKGSLRRKELWERWSQGFNLDNYQRKDRVVQSVKQKKGYIELDVISLAPESYPHRETPGERQADWGFRLGLYLLALSI